MVELPTESDPVCIAEGDCLPTLRALPSASVDAVITDPPYPCIKREYGYWTEAEWFALMNPVVEECRRVLKPTGSAVFVLQPNSERVGRMRTWLWRFMLEWGEAWGIVQDAYWWNYTALPLTKNDPSFLRGSVKPCVWMGAPNCYRGISDVLWSESESNRAIREGRRFTSKLQYRAGGQTIRDSRARTACERRGGVTPFNLMPVGADGKDGKHKHPGKTPLALARWWVRYICPPGGTVLDPFTGIGTIPLAALKEGRKALGIERFPKYAAIARKRVAECLDAGLFADAG